MVLNAISIMSATPLTLASLQNLSIIFGNLQLPDLTNAAAVCRLWAEAAEQEYLKRKVAVDHAIFVPEQLLQTCNFLATKKLATLLLVDDRDVKNGLHHLIERNYEENHNILLKVPIHKVMLNSMSVNTFEMKALRGILGLNIPKEKIVLYTEEKDQTEGLDDFFVPMEKKATYLLFGNFEDDFMDEIKLRCREKGSNSTLFGGYFFYPMSVNNKETTGIALKIVDVKSWSIVLNYKYSKEHFNQKLEVLRDKVNNANAPNTIGLLCGRILFKKPSTKKYTTIQEIMTRIKLTFPNTPFIGFFTCNASTHFYAVDSITKDPVRTLKNTNYISLIILRQS